MPLLVLVLACASGPTTSAAPPAVSPAPPAATPAPAAPVEAAPPPATPRDAADDAFNAAMQAYETKAPGAGPLVEQALGAYRALGTLDSDGQFHVAVLQLAADEPADARKTCAALLAAHPDHLLALGIDARAAQKLGDTKAAHADWDHLVAAWDKPREALPEYEDHDRFLEVLQNEALTALATP